MLSAVRSQLSAVSSQLGRWDAGRLTTPNSIVPLGRAEFWRSRCRYGDLRSRRALGGAWPTIFGWHGADCVTRTEERHLSDGACRTQLLSSGRSSRRRCRCGKSCVGQPVESASAFESRLKAVGRRGPFPEGRSLSQLIKMTPLRKITERERSVDLQFGVNLNALPKAGVRIQGQDQRPPQDQGQRRRQLTGTASG
jgi:hypothetical protein